ncbi:TolC family protein [Hydrogenimonas urashimensis]|uniref:TolC family protein n=1 Tax=Hydrogenimonas urashimensis TaxID=2740515 RepID=UPI001915D7B3|nr:TolC family protein [Hydrogenimonas urashimensis]
MAWTGRIALPVTGLAALLLLTGCTKLGPDFHGITPPPLSESLKSDRNVSDDDLADWWNIYEDETLDRLIDKALSQNLDLQTAGLRILQARAALGIATGLQYPQAQTLSGNAMSSYHRYHIDSANLSFDLAWEADIWGKYARGIESAEATLMAQVASYRAAAVSLLAEVARSYIDYRTTEERIAYAERNVAIQERVTRMTEVQYKAGNVSELDMQQSRTQLYNTRAALPAMHLAEIRIINALAVLLGTTPEAVRKILGPRDHDLLQQINEAIATNNRGIIQLAENEKNLLAPHYIPEPRFNPDRIVDASLLIRRPDIRAAEYIAHAEAAQIGIAEAALYPSFRLLGSIGYSASDPNPVVPFLTGWGSLNENITIAAGPGFSWNIFQYGRLKNDVRLKDAAFEESLVRYSKRVLTAAAEVSNALNAYRFTQIQLQEREKALEATVRAFNISVTQYHDGLVSYQRLLSTVEKLTFAQDAYARTKGELAVDAALLYKALGGGWQATDGRSYLFQKSRARMRKRGVDWGHGLDENATRMPKGWK